MKKSRFKTWKGKKLLFWGKSTESVFLFEQFSKESSNQAIFYEKKSNATNHKSESIIKLDSSYLEEQKIDGVVCCGTKLSFNEIHAINNTCNQLGISCYVISSPDFHLSRGYKKHYIYGILIYESTLLKITSIELVLKRVFDIVFSLFFILLILSWLFPILALLIKISSKGPIIFKQKRNGLDNQEFTCYKFRTMVVNVESDTKQAKEGDTRITKIGAFLRKTSVDEFPQFFNTLIGNMSIVGPRPHMIKHNEYYRKLIKDYDLRTHMRPGITGLSQVLGYRGATENDLFLMKIRVRIDIFYIKNWNFWLDLKIIFKTFFKIFKSTDNTF